MVCSKVSPLLDFDDLEAPENSTWRAAHGVWVGHLGGSLILFWVCFFQGSRLAVEAWWGVFQIQTFVTRFVSSTSRMHKGGVPWQRGMGSSSKGASAFMNFIHHWPKGLGYYRARQALFCEDSGEKWWQRGAGKGSCSFLWIQLLHFALVSKFQYGWCQWKGLLSESSIKN